MLGDNDTAPIRVSLQLFFGELGVDGSGGILLGERGNFVHGEKNHLELALEDVFRELAVWVFRVASCCARRGGRGRVKASSSCSLAKLGLNVHALACAGINRATMSGVRQRCRSMDCI